MRIHYFFHLLAVFLLGLSAAAQKSPATQASVPKNDFSKEAVVLEDFHDRTRFENDGTGERHLSVRWRVQTEAGIQALGQLIFPYDKDVEDMEVQYVRVRKPDGTVVNTPNDNLQDLPSAVTRVAPIYSNLREKHVTVSALRPGDILEYSLAVHRKTSLIPGQFWFDGNFDKSVIALHQEAELDVPATRPLKVKVQPGLQTSTREEAGRRIYTWTSSNLEHKESKTKKPGKASDGEDEQPTEPQIQVTSFQSWDEFGKWFGEIQRDRIAPTPEIRARAAELTKGLQTDSEKAQALYDYVARQFRYVGLEFGIGRLQAHPAASVMSNGYGDCKDKHTLLASMLESVGVKASPVLIHITRKMDSDVPSPSQFDHMITAVTLDGKQVFLDTTTEVAPFGMLIQPLRDKQALLVTPGGPVQIVKTPADLPFQQTQTLSVEGKVDVKGKFDATVQQTFHGDDELFLRLAFRRTPVEKWQEMAQSISFMTGFGGEVSEVSTSDLENIKVPLQIRYRYTRDDYVTWDGGVGSMRTALPPMRMPTPESLDAKPASGDTLRRVEITYRCRMEVPPDSLQNKPDNVNLKRDFGEYHSTYSIDGPRIVMERKLIITDSKITPARRKDYESFYKQVTSDADLQIELVKTGAGNSPKLDAESKDAPSNDSDPQVVNTFQQAEAALSRGDMFNAKLKLEEVTRKDPKNSYAWAELGRVQLMLRDIDGAIESLRRQLKVNPNHPKAHGLLAAALETNGDFAGGIAEMKRQVEMDPQEVFSRKVLSQMYLRSRNYKEALALLEPLAAEEPEDKLIMGGLATAYVETGAPEKAMELYEKVLKADNSPATMNNIAYTMAEHDLHLDRALELSEESVRQTSGWLRRLDLGSLSTDHLKDTVELLAAWDTLGWIYYKRGELEKAKVYLTAAWTSDQLSAVAEHLAALYDKLKVPAKASEFRTYASALPHVDPQKRGIQVLSFRPAGSTEKLQDMRTVHFTRKFKANANAEFFLLLSASGTDDAAFISGSEKLKDWTDTLKKTRFPGSFPDDSAKLVRRGVLSCQQYNGGCMMVLFPPEQVKSVQ